MDKQQDKKALANALRDHAAECNVRYSDWAADMTAAADALEHLSAEQPAMRIAMADDPLGVSMVLDDQLQRRRMYEELILAIRRALGEDGLHTPLPELPGLIQRRLSVERPGTCSTCRWRDYDFRHRSQCLNPKVAAMVLDPVRVKTWGCQEHKPVSAKKGA